MKMKNKHLIAAVPFILALILAPLAFGQDSTIGAGKLYTYAGAPSNGTSEIDTVTIGGTPTAGTFTITVAGGRTTADITWSATNATLIARVDAALEALSVIGTGGVTTADATLSSGIGTFTITFTGKNARRDFAALTATSSLTGTSPTVSISTTTAGVAATFQNAPLGALLSDTSNGELYQNISTTLMSPNWQIKGLGFRSGSGGAVTQATDRSTAVTLNTRTGKVTTTASSMAAQTPTTFTVTNSTVAATDTVVISKLSGDVDTFAWVNSTAAGSFTVTLFNSHASAADTTAFVFDFTVIKGAID